MYHDGDYSWEDPLVPIPNTTVKLSHVDDIWLETARENRSLPSTWWELVWYGFFFLRQVSSQIDKGSHKTIVLKGGGAIEQKMKFANLWAND